MKQLGIFLILVGAVWGLVAWNMETTVDSFGGMYYPSSKVHNIGLIEKQRNHLMGAGLILLIGVILFATSSRTTQTTNLSTAKKCPFCAELVKVEAVFCKHCGKALPEITPATPSSNAVEVAEKQSHRSQNRYRRRHF